MKRLLIPATLVASLLAATILPSCKKDESTPSRSEMLVGSWKTSEQGDDTNGNGTWDVSEHAAVPAAEVATSKFNSDGTGTATGTLAGTPITLNFTWNLQNNDNDLRLITSFFGTPDTSVQSILTLNSTDMILKDNSSSTASFESYKKQ